ncbi:MAG: amidohydrolase [Erysipelotrichia bacterium]|nr:amidohydrolase [Erysipelotrichia bacterium]
MSLSNELIQRVANEENDYVIDCRRAIHKMAEISGTEEKTSAFIIEEIKKAGLPFEMVSKTGLIATLDTGKAGPGIALRADIDALPLHEEDNNQKGPRTCVSDNPGTCHACGHDAHAAMLLGAIKALTANKDKLSGTIYFCFEEGEENGGGAVQMLEAMGRRHIDTCWAIHVYAGLDSGRICVDPGPRMAGAAGAAVTVIGKGGHGSRPDMTSNPVFCAAAILTNLSTAFVNQITAGQTVTCGMASIQGGTTGNIIPDKAEINGSFRFFDVEQGAKAVEILKSVATHTAAMNKCTVEFDPRTRVLVTPVINDTYYGELARKALTEVLPKGAVVSCEPWYASESFSRVTAKYRAVFAHLGINNAEYGSGAPHHNGFFDVDENVLKLGVMSTLKYVSAVEDLTEWPAK